MEHHPAGVPPLHDMQKFPAGMRALKQWVVTDESKKPYDPKTGHLASVTDPSTWGTFDQAVKALNGRFTYPGFVFTDGDPFTGIDLDDKPEGPATKEQKERHSKIIKEFASYTERSSSLRGFHIIVRGKIPASLHRDNVEVYSRGRFFAMTGDRVNENPVADGQLLLDKMAVEMDRHVEDVPTDQPEDYSDAEVSARARTLDPEALQSLLDGTWEGVYESQSSADFDLVYRLVLVGASNVQVRRIFLDSGLGQREKARRKDYLPRTIAEARRKRAGEAADERKAIEHGREQAERLLTNWRTSRQQAAASLLVRFEDFGPITLAPGLVKGVLGEGGRSVLYGEPGSGKSFIGLDLAISVATGSAWLGRYPTKQGPVVYAAGEGVGGLRLRRTALLKERRHERPPLAFLPLPFDAPDQVDLAVAVLDEAARMYGKEPVLLIIDTLNRYFGDGDENTARDMKRFLSAIDRICKKFPNLHVLIIHHAGKDPTKGMRGSTALKGAVDTAIECTKSHASAGEPRFVATVVKQKDGEEGLGFPFRLKPVVVGQDADGNEVKSCVVVPDTATGSAARTLTESQAIAVKVLADLSRADALIRHEIDYGSYRDGFCTLRASHDQSARKAASRAIKDLRDKFSAVAWADAEGPIHLHQQFWNLTAQEAMRPPSVER